MKLKGYSLGAWWHSSGSDQRYTPRWCWERDAYIEGLRDALRIAEDVRRQRWHDDKARSALTEAEQKIYARAHLISPETNSHDPQTRD